jgi:hypothetical protein
MGLKRKLWNIHEGKVMLLLNCDGHGHSPDSKMIPDIGNINTKSCGDILGYSSMSLLFICLSPNLHTSSSKNLISANQPLKTSSAALEDIIWEVVQRVCMQHASKWAKLLGKSVCKTSSCLSNFKAQHYIKYIFHSMLLEGVIATMAFKAKSFLKGNILWACRDWPKRIGNFLLEDAKLPLLAKYLTLDWDEICWAWVFGPTCAHFLNLPKVLQSLLRIGAKVGQLNEGRCCSEKLQCQLLLFTI